MRSILLPIVAAVLLLAGMAYVVYVVVQKITEVLP